MKKMKVLIALSGGLDSCVLATNYIKRGHDVGVVVFTYGSKHNEYETAKAEDIIAYLDIKSSYRINASNLFTATKSNLLKIGGDIPEGHYQDDNMKQTVVPGRNLIFASIMASIAESNDYDAIALGVHAGDHAIYPDCRPIFIQSLYRVILLSSDRKLEVQAPFINMDKAAIVKRGFELNAPMHLTRTCYKNQAYACGKCGSCVERLEAFKLNGAVDPALYGVTN